MSSMDVVEKLKAASEGLLFSSEADFRLKFLFGKGKLLMRLQLPNS